MPISRALRIAIYALVILGLALLLRSSDREPPADRPAFLLILLDTVRADRLGCYGNAVDLTPQLDRFAAGAARFAQAYAQAPWTLPSVASLFTSQWVQEHGAGGGIGEYTALPEEARTIAEQFRSGGYATALISNVVFLSEKFGLDQGFAEVDLFSPASNLECRRAEVTTELALAWLAEHRTAPFFLVVHYFDPHLIYDPPQPFRARYADPRDAHSSEVLFGRSDELIDSRQGRRALHFETVARLAKLYLGEIAYVDREVGRLLDGLRSQRLEARTVVVVAADHGEEFGDHGNFEHGHSFYQELVRVPLLLRVPPELRARHGLPDDLCQEIEQTVRLIDVAPTLCELGGLSPAASFRGVSLLPLLQGKAQPERVVLIENSMWTRGGVAWLRGGWKLIQQASDAEHQLFDLRRDPAERYDRAAENPPRLAELRGELEEFRSQLGVPAESRAPQLDAADRERLRSLGYLD